MAKETMKQQVKEWKANYDAFNRMEVDWRRKATFADRIRDLSMVLEAANQMPARERPLLDEAIMSRWNRIRGAHGR